MAQARLPLEEYYAVEVRKILTRNSLSVTVQATSVSDAWVRTIADIETFAGELGCRPGNTRIMVLRESEYNHTL